jgi:glycosyltransferase involved in cell wall biosynthesis
MRLVILTQYFLPEMGAPQSRLYELATGLRSLNWEVDVVTAMPNYPTGRIFNEYRGRIKVDEMLDGISVKRFWMYPSNSTRTFPRLVSMATFAFMVLGAFPLIRKRKPDYVFVESPPLPLAFSALIMARAAGAKLVMNVSDLWPLSAKELGAIEDGYLYRCIEFVEKLVYKKAYLCTGQSQEIVEYISARNADRVHLFRNGVDSKRFVNAARNGDHSKIRLVYAGLLGVAQGLLPICRNVRFSDLRVEFHIYGAGAERQQIEDFIVQNPDSGIFLHPPVPREQISAIMSQFDGALIPLAKRIYGAVPSKIYEAMAAGLPIIFSGEGEAAQIIRDRQVGWVSKPENFRNLESNISDFVSNPHRRSLYAANGIRSAKEVFEREIQIRKLNDYLQLHLAN